MKIDRLMGITVYLLNNGKYPARKSIQTEFADSNGLLFQVDGIAYSTK